MSKSETAERRSAAQAAPMKGEQATNQPAEQREPTQSELNSFLQAAKALQKLGARGLHIYLANDQMNLMTGPSHSGGGTPHPERVRLTVWIPNAGGGDW